MTHRALIVLLAVLAMVGAISIDAYLPALPAIAHDFGVTPAAAQQTLTVYLTGFAVMMLFYGTLSDSFGRRPVILVALVIYLVSSLGAMTATSLGWLILFRACQGLSAGTGEVVGQAMVTDLMKGAEAQRALSYIGVIFGLAPAIAPVIGGWLQSAFGWRSIFVFIAGFTFLLLLACLRWLPESLPPCERQPFQLKVIVRSYWNVGRHAQFILRATAYALSFSGILVYVASAPDFVFNILHLTAKDFAWLFVPMIGGITLGAAISARLSHHWSRRHLIAVSYGTMFAAALVSLFYAANFTTAFAWALIPLFVYGLGMNLGMPAMMMICLETFPRTRGLAASFLGFIFMIIFAIGSGAICPLLFGSAFHLAAGAVGGLLLSGVCWLLARGIPTTMQEPGFDGRVQIGG